MATTEHDEVGPYQVLRLLGTGGMAQVYHAVKREEGVTIIVALKVPRQHIVMDDAAREHFLREARITARMGSHANIVHVVEVGVDNGLPYMALEYVTGANLSQLCKAMMKAGERWTERQILWVIANVLQGLKHAWGALAEGKPLRIVHRDISPSNIMLTHEGYVKITDFGISQMAGLESSGLVRGKARYMPGEQLQGRATSASDMYAVGAIAWELIEGRRFRGDKLTQDEMLLAAYNGERPEITRDDISPRLIQLVYSLLDPNEKTRIQSPMDAWAELMACPGINVVNPDPVQALLEKYFGQRRSGCTDVDVVVVHPELVATRAAIAATSQALAEEQALRREADDQQDVPQRRPVERRVLSPIGIGPKPEYNEVEAEPEAADPTLVLDEAKAQTNTTTAPMLPPKGGTAEVPVPAAMVSQTAPLTRGDTLPSTLGPDLAVQSANNRPAASTKARRWIPWLAILGASSAILFGVVGHFAWQDQQEAAGPAQSSRPTPLVVVANPTSQEATTNAHEQGHEARAVAPTRIQPDARPTHEPITRPQPTKQDTTTEVETDARPTHEPTTRPQPAKQDTTTEAETTSLDEKKTTRAGAPKPKTLARAKVHVRLDHAEAVELRVGSRIRHISGDSRLTLRAGTRKLAVRSAGTTTWYSTTERLKAGDEYLLRVSATRIWLTPMPKGLDQ